MTDKKATRLSKIARELNVGISTIVDFLHSKGESIDSNPNTKITPEHYDLLHKEFSTDLNIKKESEKVNLKQLREKKETISINDKDSSVKVEMDEDADEVLIRNSGSDNNELFETETEKKLEEKINLHVVGKIDLEPKVKKVKEEVKPVEPVEEVVKEEPVPAPKPEPAPEPAPVQETPKEQPTAEVEEPKQPAVTEPEPNKVKVVGKIDLESINQKTRPDKRVKGRYEPNAGKPSPRPEHNKDSQPQKAKESLKVEKVEKVIPTTPSQQAASKDDEVIRARVNKLSGPTVLGKIELPQERKPSGDKPSGSGDKKRKRKRIRKDTEKVSLNKDEKKEFKPRQEGESRVIKGKKRRGKERTPEISEEDIQKQVKDTLARLTSKGSKSKTSKHRREKRDIQSQRMQEEMDKQAAEKNILRVTEFVSVNELANMMSVPVNEIIATCMNLGLFVSINQRLDAETLSILADEYNYKVEFITVELQESIEEEEDNEEDLTDRPPIVTVMGHVDHGKTKLLDQIRHANVIAGEAGGITQHIGAYSVQLKNDKKITFLDTPGHEAFTAMRARGAQITDVAIIVVAADDGVMPQTVEAINHAQAAGVPMIFAINKIDVPAANPERIKEALANMNILVEDWGGKYQSQEISAKNGINIEELLEKVLLEAEMLELKANANKRALGTVVESSLDKGRGYVATILVQAGTLRIGDIVLAGGHHGRVKAMYNERGKSVKEAGPSTPVLILGLDGAPQAGDKFNVMENEREARDIANKREQLQREQEQRTQKHITLDEIGRRIAIGNFQELNVIIKGDVDGSVEALADSLLKLSTEEIQVNIKHKAVGQISEADILLAAASNAIVIGFQVRPSMSARKLAEKEEIDVRLYSIIYDAIEEVKSAMEGMLSPEVREEITSTLEVLETFKITKVGTIAGCIVREGKIKRDSKVRIIRDGIVIYTGELGSLKRFKDDAKEVVSGLECGLNIDKFNDLKVGDLVEGFIEYEVKKTL